MTSLNRARAILSTSLLVAACVTMPALAEPGGQPPRDCAQEFESAQRLRKEGKLKAAAEASISCSQPACPTFISKECTNIFSEVQSSIPSITVRATDGRGQLLTDVEVYMDGQLITKVIDGRAVSLDPGVHEFRFVPAGKPEQTVKVLVAEGEKNKVVSADFPSLEPQASGEAPEKQTVQLGTGAGMDVVRDKKSGPPVASYVLGGIGLAAIGAGVVLRLVADKDFDDAEKTCKPDCSKSTTDSIDLKYNLSIASLAVGGAAIAAGAVVWIVQGTGSSEKASAHRFSLRPVAVGNGVVAGWQGTF